MPGEALTMTQRYIQGDADAELAAAGIMRGLLDDVAAFLAAHATRWTVTNAAP